MTEIGFVEARSMLSTLLDRAANGEEMVITRRGRPVAKLVPYQSEADQKEADEAARRLRDRARAKKRGRSDWQEWKGQRDQGPP